MLHFFKFSSDALDIAPARDVYQKRGPGKGWPEECPPIRAANSYGWDVLANFDMDFRRKSDGSWRLVTEYALTADWTFANGMLSAPHEHDDDCEHEEGEDPGLPQVQVNAWFWEKDQTIPHKITRNVWKEISNQVKVSTYHYFATDPNELLMMTDVPNQERPYRAMSAVVDTDWYPASYPWHCVLELDRREKRIVIERGTPICRLLLVPRGQFFATEMQDDRFQAFFARSQRWLAENGRGDDAKMLDITGAYVRSQRKSRFDVNF